MHRRHILILIGVTFAVIAAILLPSIEPIRSWRIIQTKELTSGISMRVEDVYLFPSGTNNFLRFRCGWVGSNSLSKVDCRATIRTTPKAIESDTKVWQVGVPDDGKGGIPFVWEFLNPPQANSKYIVRIYYRRTDNGGKEQFVDFSIPNLPKVTPNGEVKI